MNIDRLNQNLASGAYGKRAGRAGEAGAAAGGSSSTGGASGAAAKSDGVLLSDQARAVARAQAAVRAAPDVREQLVAELREQIQNGTYQIDDEAIVNRILEGQS
jgi:negative regulator of flagellin synthesis FlgM